MPGKKTRFGLVLATLASAISAVPAMAQLKAFSGAEGFGAVATGGRTGTIYHVTNLNDSGAGSFRDAVSASNRIIVFDVGGYIKINSAISASSNLTILGQTAPGQGIGIYGAEVSFNGRSNDIVRYVRFRDTTLDPKGQSTDNSSGNCLNLGTSTNMIFDHVSCEFASYNNIDAVQADGLTFQNSIVANPITAQQFNFHWEGTQGTFLNNVFVDAHNRSILSKGNVQYVNNSIYNYQAAFTTGNSSGKFSFDILNNYFITGPSTTSTNNDFYQVDSNQSAYASGNMLDGNRDGVLNGGSDNTVDSAVVLNSPWSSATAALPLLSASASYNFNLAHSGVSLQHDATTFATSAGYDPVDAQVVSNVQTLGSAGRMWSSQTQTGLPNGGMGTINTGAKPTDTDNDGLPDGYESLHGMNPSAADSTKLSPLGYTMIEQYANEIADSTLAARTWTSTSGEWTANGVNWSGGSSPIPYDRAQVWGSAAANGSLNISQAGAVSYSLSIGGGGSPAAGDTISVNGGSLTVYNLITVGDQANGNLLINSGTVTTDSVQIGNTLSGTTYNGSVIMNGGVLQTGIIAQGGGAPSAWTNGGSITFNSGTIGAISNLNVTAPVNIAGNANFDTNGNNGTMSGTISGAGTLTKWDTGSLNLTADNAGFTGAVVIKGGELGISSNSNVGGATSPITFNGGLLRINGTSLTSIDTHAVNWSTFAGGFDIASSGNSFTVGQSISGSGSFTKDGPGLLTLTASSSFSGGTNLKAGTLAISSDDNIGGPTRAINFQGGELRILGTAITSLDLHNVNWSSFNGGIDVNASNNTVTISHSIGGNGALTKDGPGTLVLAASNSFTGVLTINAGVLRLGNANAISNVTLNLITGGGSLDLNGFSSAIGNIAGSGPLDLKGQVFSAGSNGVDSTYSGVISDSVGGGNFVKTGKGALTLSGTSTFPSTLTIKSGEIDTPSIPNSNTNSPIGRGAGASNLVLDGGRLSYSGTSTVTTNRVFTVGPGGGTIDSGAGNMSWTSTDDLAMTGTGDRTLFLDGSYNSNYFLFGVGDPTSGKTSLTKNGGGRWFIANSTSAASLTYSGNTTINSGTLLLYKNPNMLPFGPGKGNLYVNSGTFDMRQDQGVNGLYGAGTIMGINNSQIRTLTVGNADASGSFGGAITSTIAVVKTGTGVQVLSGANNYVGGTTINGGVLQFNQASSIGGSGANVTVNTNGIAAAGYAMDQAFLGRIVTSSQGAVALAANSSNALSFASYPNLELGAVGNVTYTGALTPNGTTYRLGGATGTLTLSNANALTGARDLQLFGGGAVSLTNSNNYTGATTINAGGVLLAKSITSKGALNINSGSVILTTKPQALDPTGTSILSGVSITGTGKIDIANNAVVVDWTTMNPIASIKQQIQSGAMTSSLLDSDHAIGFGDAGSMGIGSFAGSSLDGSAVVLRATVIGDDNLDGTVNALDFTRFAANFNDTGTYWSDGDFTGDGVVNALDFNALASHFGASMSSPVLGQLVPEPGSIATLTTSILLLLKRRRRSI